MIPQHPLVPNVESSNRCVIDCYKAASIYMMVTTTIFYLMRQVSAIPYWDCHFPKYVVREQCSSPWTWQCPDQQTGSLSHLISITAGTGSCGIMVSNTVLIGCPQVRITFHPQSAHKLGVLWAQWGGDWNHSWISFTSWIRLCQVQSLSWSPQLLCSFLIFAGVFWSELSSGRIRRSPEGFSDRGLIYWFRGDSHSRGNSALNKSNKPTQHQLTATWSDHEAVIMWCPIFVFCTD